MKPFAFLLAPLVALLLSHCASKPPKAPGSDAFSGDEESAYRLAYYYGYQDGHRNQEDNYERYYRDYVTETEMAFQRGYQQGYTAGAEHVIATVEAEDSAYTRGYETGRSDAENGNSPFYQRHRKIFNENTEASFQKGYQLGYQEARHDLGGASKGEQEAYSNGYRQGEQDRGAGLPSDTSKHSGQSILKQADAFQKGYEDGYLRRTPRF